jgi:hypothetical protein
VGQAADGSERDGRLPRERFESVDAFKESHMPFVVLLVA